MDRRQKKSRKVICDALLQLMKDKPIEQITIKELTDLADVNRKTFYNNYSSIKDVRKEMDMQIADVFFSLVDAEDMESKLVEADLDPNTFIHRMITVIEDDRSKAKLVFESGETHHLLKHVHDSLQPYIVVLAKEHNISEAEVEYALHFIASGTVTVLNSWLHEEYPISSAEFEKVLIKLIGNTINPSNC